MKKLRRLSLFCVVTITMGLFVTCQKDNKDVVQKNEYVVQFSVDPSALKNATQLKAKNYACDISNARYVYLTIVNPDGSPTLYNNYLCNVYRMNGLLFTDKLILKDQTTQLPVFYKLTMFQLIDSAKNTIFATPYAGSELAPNVKNPLPMSFEVMKNETNSVTVEVLCTDSKKPESFGFESFNIVKVNQFSFLVAVVDSETQYLLSARITVYNNVYELEKFADSVANNIIIVRSGLGLYSICIQKLGYETYKRDFTEDQLKVFDGIGNHLPLSIKLKKSSYPAIQDIDGNVYRIITIGTQTWMAENLRTTHFRNGDAIPYVQPYFDCQNYPWHAYANYDNNPRNACIYGRLYIGRTMLDSRKISPAGWHVPTEAEWKTLINYVGGESVAGGKLKETGTVHWNDPNAGAINSVGFTALPGGCRFQGCGYIELGTNAYFWTSTLSGVGWPEAVMLTSSDPDIFWRGIDTEFYSIRCIKD